MSNPNEFQNAINKLHRLAVAWDERKAELKKAGKKEAAESIKFMGYWCRMAAWLLKQDES
ncbi:MAG: hypothetical protein M1608_17430 [Candidatus Omnitrophica bacterium]|nr:hypothetical protein [Candidatus Omnitrophota bacterium]